MKKPWVIAVISLAALVVGLLLGWGISTYVHAQEAQKAAQAASERYEALEVKLQESEDRYDELLKTSASAEKSLELLSQSDFYKDFKPSDLTDMLNASGDLMDSIDMDAYLELMKEMGN